MKKRKRETRNEKAGRKSENQKKLKNKIDKKRKLLKINNNIILRSHPPKNTKTIFPVLNKTYKENEIDRLPTT